MRLTQQQEGHDEAQRDGRHAGGLVQPQGQQGQPDHQEAGGVPILEGDGAVARVLCEPFVQV